MPLLLSRNPYPSPCGSPPASAKSAQPPEYTGARAPRTSAWIVEGSSPPPPSRMNDTESCEHRPVVSKPHCLYVCYTNTAVVQKGVETTCSKRCPVRSKKARMTTPSASPSKRCNVGLQKVSFDRAFLGRTRAIVPGWLSCALWVGLYPQTEWKFEEFYIPHSVAPAV